jgi:hypothetical protein
MTGVSRTTIVKTRDAKAALILRLAGASYTEVAETVGYKDATAARNAVIQALAKTQPDEVQVNELRAVDSARLERLLRGVWQKATSPTDPEHLQAAKLAMSLIDRHIRLHGLDAPQEVVVYNPAAAEIDAWVARMVKNDATNVIEGEVVDA